MLLQKLIFDDIFKQPDKLKDLLERCTFNWVALSEIVQEEFPDIDVTDVLTNILYKLPYLELSSQQLHLIEQSQQVFKQIEEINEENAKIENGLIVSDDDWNEMKDPLKKRGELNKKIAEQNILKRRQSKNVEKILNKYPNIGKDIEQFVQQAGVGTDAWRTGVLTFDGNRKVKKKVTFHSIKKHLEEKYKTNFSYGSIVQLCVARNKRRINAKNYKGVAKVTCRRSRKGFDLKFNQIAIGLPHCTEGWTTSNTRKIPQHAATNVPPFASKTRFLLLPKLTTNRSTHVHCKPRLITSLERKTKVNFVQVLLRDHFCIKKPCAAYADDLQMLQEYYEIKFCEKETSVPKEIECIRVDSSSDEAPCFEEVQFWWTKRHFERPTHVQLVTSRQSGGSNLNRVELQNGCEVKARASLFIPSTLNGLNSDGSGKVDDSKLKNNLSDAIGVYISRVDGAPCGDTNIRLYRGANSEDNQLLSGFVKTFLNGLKKQKWVLEMEHPHEYDHIKRIWDIRNSHINKSVPQRYIFQLFCYEKNCHPLCPHPLCQVGRPENKILWYNGRPSIECIPLPVPDPKRPFGAEKCSSCDGECAGHFLPAEEVIQLMLQQKRPFGEKRPPSDIIKLEFKRKGNQLLKEDSCRDLAKQVLLRPAEVTLWLEHLKSVQKHRIEGAKKAAQTRKQKMLSKPKPKQKNAKKNTSERDESICGKCQEENPTDTVSDTVSWVMCDECCVWFHVKCVEVISADVQDSWFCNTCLNKSFCQLFPQ
ncbi:Chromatin modification-related YNG2 [Paramuricea clavata]|uniref:Chromatin modification-related YNG2 n=1 Tax=Paramuricea clavata TaxID=317549 RepID=A0A7D9HRG2_PARCT|nr:Chromatin modification-related YNG2 [Paramuricea clavata]